MPFRRTQSRKESVQHLHELRKAMEAGPKDIVYPDWLFSRKLWKEDYKIVEDTGLQGGQGIIRFAVRKDGSGSECAIKTLRKELSDGEREIALQDLRWEAAAMTLVSLAAETEHVVHALDAYDWGSGVALVMPRLSKWDRPRVMEQSGWEREQGAAADFRDILFGVRALHGLQMVHLDLKPANFLRDPETGVVKLVDFGLARIAVPCSGETVDDFPRDLSRGVCGTLSEEGGSHLERQKSDVSQKLDSSDFEVEEEEEEEDKTGKYFEAASSKRNGDDRASVQSTASTPRSILRSKWKRLKFETFKTPNNVMPGHSPGFVSPETLDTGYFSPSTDSFALGVVLGKMLSRFPSDCCASGKGEFLRPSDWDDISVEAQDLILGLVDPDPDRRLCAHEALGHVWIKRCAAGWGGEGETTHTIISGLSGAAELTDEFWTAALEHFNRRVMVLHRQGSDSKGLKLDEFVRLMEKWKMHRRGIPLKGLFRAIDRDRSNSVEWEELRAALRTLAAPESPAERAKLAFRMYADEQGILSPDGLSDVLRTSFSRFANDPVFAETRKYLHSRISEIADESNCIHEQDFVDLCADPKLEALFLSPGRAAMRRLELDGLVDSILAHPLALLYELYLIPPRNIYILAITILLLLLFLYSALNIDVPYYCDSLALFTYKTSKAFIAKAVDSKGVVDEFGSIDQEDNE